ncbi:MAG: Calx-beta domain-containing protein, partial [Chitinophagaceae bacterium]
GNSYAQSNSYSFTNTGLLRGYGIMDLGQGGIASNLGRLSPGDSIGSLTLKFRQSMILDELNIQLGNAAGPGSGHDIFTFFGDLTLSGTLNVSELSVMPEGNYTIVRKDSGSLSGTFTTTNLPGNYAVQYFTDSIVLVKILAVPPKNISISSPAAITEGNSGQKELKFVVRLNQASTGTVKVNYTTADSTAIQGEDFTAVSGTMTIDAGKLTDTIRVPILGDRLVEANEKIKMLLSNPINGIITAALGIGTINNDDALPAISITNYTLSEGTSRDSMLQIQVRLSASYPLPVTVSFATQDSTATDGIDYSGASGTLTFLPGDTLEYIPVFIKGDGIDEANEIINI